MSSTTPLARLIFLASLAASCASKDEETATTTTNTPVAAVPTTTGGRALVSIPVKLTDKNGTSLALAAATTFSMDLTDCASGYTSTATNVSSDLQVYSYDRDCLVKLTQFTLNGFTYEPGSGTDFTTWLAGDTATFEATTDATNKLTLKVLSTLANPVTGAETVAYRFTNIVKGGDETLGQVDVGDAHAMSVTGQAAPSFTIHSTQLSGISATGAGQFDFVLECTSNITGSSTTTACLDSLYTDLKYKLIKDIYSDTITYAQAQTIMASGTSSVTTATDVVAVGTGGTTHGGFNTVRLDGPDQIHNNPHMLLVIEVAGLSYLYFNVDVTTLTQN